MTWFRRKQPLVSVVVPAYGVEEWLGEALRSLVQQSHTRWEAVVVDDGSVDRTGEIADEWAHRDARITVLHTANGGLGAARNVGLRHVRGDYVTFLDSDDVLPPTAYSALVGALEASGSDFATGSIVRWENGQLNEPPWMRRLHRPPRRGTTAAEHPEILGDVFATNKLFRRSWWEAQQLAFPERVRYEDQPLTTRAYLRARFDVLDEVVYHWRIREDGTSISQQRASVADLRDRWETKRMALASVREAGNPAIEDVFLDRVLAGDLWRYFLLLPGAGEEWWRILRAGILEFWGRRSLVTSGLPPVHRLTGWLVEQDRRADAVAVMEWFAGLEGGAPRVQDADSGRWRLSLPHRVLDESTVAPQALAVRDHEV
ncbi:MAG: glycosyltransferase family 2 protein [Nocardioides sp.]|uniref:glycosyltransferase family 2 protein n=1 Tax=Nocardioides sp. TaxID=35761 RepID=UPI003F00A143